MVFFYISGHGFGHAVRQIAIVDELASLAPGLPIAVRSGAPRWLFERTVRAPHTFLGGEVDTGVVQRDSLALDEEATLQRTAAFYADLERRAADEAALLRQHGATLAIADAPPLACAAAAAAGIPSVVCSNFTWDWIYEDYVGRCDPPPAFLGAIRDAYRHAAAGWRLPMHGGFSAIAPLVDLPFVTRTPRQDRSRAEIRAALGLPAGVPLALVSFGGYGVDGLALDRIDCTGAWGVVFTGEASRLRDIRRAAPAVLTVDEPAMYAHGLRYEDVVAAVDVVVTKPGYGIISDCVASGTALLYTSRGRFAEYDVLVAEMPRVLRCRYIDTGDLLAGRWRHALDALLAAPPPPERPRIDGARVAAAMILERAPDPAPR